MSKRTDTTLIVLAGVLALAVFVVTLSANPTGSVSVPAWYWFLIALLLADLLALAVVRGIRSIPQRSEVITNLVTGAIFLVLYTQTAEGSLTRIMAMIIALYFLTISGIRFILMVGRKPG